MKKYLLSLTALALLGSAANAQNPLKQNIAVIGKITANWCPPCGKWGMPLMDDLTTANAANATGLAIYSSKRTDNSNEKFQNQAAYDLEAMITLSGYPSFSANFIDKSQANTTGSSVNTGGIKTDVNAAVAAFAAAPVVASTGMTYRINGNIVEVKTKTKFWQAASGTYRVAVYLVEDGAIADQNSMNSSNQTIKLTNAEHHNVLRTSMSATTWGEQIASGSIAKDQEYTKDFTFDLSAAFFPAHADKPNTWDKTKLVPFAVIYKVNGTSYEYVNGANHYDFPASVGEINNIESVALFPNPATSQTSLSFDMREGGNVVISVIDNIGRTVYNSGEVKANAGRVFHSINTSGFSAGLYNVVINSKSGVITQKLAVE